MPIEFGSIYPEGPNTAAMGGGGGADSPQINVDYPGLPPGAVPDSRDVTITTIGTTDLWTPAPGKEVVIVSAFISTDVAGRVAIVAGSDVQGSRIAVLRAAANGGASPNLTPAPYPCGPGVPVRVVTAAAGNVDIRVTGYER